MDSDDPDPAAPDPQQADKAYEDPKFAITKVYTRKGDDGETSLVGGQRIGKDDRRIEAYGTVDELNAVVGLVRAELAGDADEAVQALDDLLALVQHGLFNLGSIFATLPKDIQPRQPRIASADIKRLESDMDARTRDLPALRSFILPGGSRANALLHLARTVCRRAERIAVALHREEGCAELDLQYLNRLSDAFFVWSRWIAARQGHDEVLWDPNAAP